MEIMVLITILGMTRVYGTMHCDKELNYHDDYQKYGFDIFCEDIDKNSQKIFENLTAYQEVTLKLDNSVLNNVTSGTFKNLKQIRKLFIMNSVLTYNYNEPIFQKLSYLEHITINNSSLVFSSASFRGLIRLKELALNNMNLTALDKRLFLNIRTLESLEISNNFLVNIKELPICDLENLQSLNLAHNLIADLSQFSFICQKSSDQLDLAINQNDKQVNLLTTYSNTRDISSSLIYLDLSNNRISDLKYALDGLGNLKFLNLDNNHIIKIKTIMFKHLTNLEVIRLNNNSINFIEDGVFQNKSNLNEIHLEENRLLYLYLHNLPSLLYLYLTKNSLNSAILKIFGELVSLNFLDLSANKIDQLPPKVFQKYSSLHALNLSSQKIVLHEQSFIGLLQLTELNISNNEIKVIPRGVFETLTSLVHLDISRNKITSIPNNTFDSLIILETLNLSNNSLQNLEYALFERLHSLRLLDIAGNNLRNIQYDLIISKLPSLSVINIRRNKLSCSTLSRMVIFFRDKLINFSINEFGNEYEKENVKGIYCIDETRTEINSVETSGSSAMTALITTLIVVVILIATATSSYKAYIYCKRRKYKAEEFELIDE